MGIGDTRVERKYNVDEKRCLRNLCLIQSFFARDSLLKISTHVIPPPF